MLYDNSYQNILFFNINIIKRTKSKFLLFVLKKIVTVKNLRVMSILKTLKLYLYVK